MMNAAKCISIILISLIFYFEKCVFSITIKSHAGDFSDLFIKNGMQTIGEQRCIINIMPANVKLSRFWRSTGVCPPEPHQDAYKFFNSQDFLHNLALIGSLPLAGITHIRMHWMLNLIRMRMNNDFTVVYNFTYLDGVIKSLFQFNLSPGFELMGNPSNFFSDFENKTQIYLWKDLIAAVAQRYVDIYGIKYVSKWRFESWNEPDHHDFDGLNFTIKGFLNYYDACSEGLKSVDKILKFGGPGGSCRPPGTGNSPFCWALLTHCTSGENYFTNETGVRLDFISFHKKGNETSKLILQEELETLRYIYANFMNLTVPFFNDEADPLKNWSLPKLWRADVTYAALVAKVIIEHIQYYVGRKDKSKRLHLGLLSNDNGFLSYYPNQFLQRTLLARFQINNTVPSHVQFIRKPVYSAIGMISNLGSTLLDTKVDCYYNDGSMCQDNLKAVSTYCNKERKCFSVLISNSADTNSTIGVAHVHLNINLLDFNASSAMWALYQLNNIKTNPYAAWQKSGSVAFPSVSELKVIKGQEEPFLEKIGEFYSTSPITLTFDVFRPGISLLNVCIKGDPPSMVKKVQILETSKSSIQIIWKDIKNRCVATYIVEYSIFKNGPFKKLNSKFSFFPSYWHACLETDLNCTVQGYYRIQVQDYWTRKSLHTKPVKF